METSHHDEIYLHLNSDEGTLVSTGSWIFKIPPVPEDFDLICLTQANIPVSFWMINPGFNSFILKEGNQSVTISITQGNYSLSSFKPLIQQLLTNNSPNGYTYTVNFPTASQANQGFFTYTCSNNTTPISISFPNGYVNELMGFKIGSTNNFTSGSLISTTVIKYIPEDVLILYSTFCDSVGAGNKGGILAELYFNNSIPFSNQTYLCPDVKGFSRLLSRGKVLNSILDISITDQSGSPIDFHGLPININVKIYKDAEYAQRNKIIEQNAEIISVLKSFQQK